MAIDLSYTEGVIAARDKYLLKDKILRLCEMTPDDAFRSLLEYGFGGGVETATSVYEYEKLIAREEELLDAFILEYAPTKANAAYFLFPRDFHNAKALVKAKLLGVDAEKLLASQGMIALSTLSSCVESGNYDAIAEFSRLKDVCENIESIYSSEEKLTGMEIGVIFERALYRQMLDICKHNLSLKRSIQAKIDMTNLLTAFRATDELLVSKSFIEGGKLSLTDILSVRENDKKGGAAFEKYTEFLSLCSIAKEKGSPLTAAERYRDGYDVEKLSQNRYELKKNEPFVYYVLRRKAESANVRIIFALLLLGANEQEIKKRLRGV